jgi:Ca2+-binding RTX toxin-like protein
MATIIGTNADDLLNGTNTSDTISGLEGNDTIHGNQGDDTIVGEQESLSYSNINGVITIPTAVTFGNDSLFGDQGNDTVYGDLINLTFKVEAGTDSHQTFGGASVANPITVTFGSDTIDGGEGDDVLVGDVGTILLSAHAGTAINNIADAVLQNITIVGGADTIIGGNGNDAMYGDVQIMTLESLGGLVESTNGFGETSSTRIRGITFQGGDDHLSGGNGDNLLVGDIGTLNFTAKSGDTLGAEDASTARISSQGAQLDQFFMGNDSIAGGNGNDVMVGDVNQINISAIASLASGLDSGGGVRILSDYLHGGNDSLNGGNGNDSLFGDVQSIVTFEHGGVAPLVPGSIPGVFENGSEPFVAFNWLMGNDQLIGGNGDDLLVGDVGTISTALFGGFTATGNIFSSASAGEGVFAVVTRVFGNDYLSGGSGDDLLYGDAQSIDYLLQGGVNVGTTISQVAAVAGNFTVTYITGNDVLDGGDGNDTLVGDVGAFTITANNGVGVGTVPFPNDIHITYGNDTLLGGAGNDALYGDEISAGELHFLIQGFLFNTQAVTNFDPRFATLPDSVIFGNDKLDGGSGNDFLVGDTLNMPGLVAGQPNNAGASIDPSTPGEIFTSTLLWGNDVYTGGAGADKFVETFDLHMGTPSSPIMQMQGADVFTDFTPAQGDKIVFGNVLDTNGDSVINAADLDKVASFVNFMLGSQKELAIIFHESSVSSATAATDYATAINNFLSAHPAATLTDVAQYIYQSSTGVSSPTLAGDVSAADAPHGALILEGHSTAEAGYANFVSMNNVLHALEVHATTATIHP